MSANTSATKIGVSYTLVSLLTSQSKLCTRSP